jgi:CO/xanthine dehydrogenase FAD-binding subunit
MKEPEYRVATSLAEALTTLGAASGPVGLVAGGTDIMVQLAKGRVAAVPSLLVDISRLEALRGIRVEDGGLRVGALVTLAELADSPDVLRIAPALAQAAAAAASRQIRSRATVGGNVANASPAADTVPALIALAATAEVAGQGGKREISVADLATGPGRTCLDRGEIIMSFTIAPRLGSQGQAFLKFGHRKALSISVVNAAACVTRCGDTVAAATLALGAVAPVVLRSRVAEGLLVGRVPTDGDWELVRGALRDEVSPISDLRATAAYRREMAAVYGQRALRIAYGAANPVCGTRGTEEEQ